MILPSETLSIIEARHLSNRDLNKRGVVFKGIHLLGIALFCFDQIKIVKHVKCCAYRKVAYAHVEFLFFARNLFQPVMVDTHSVHL